MHHATSLLKSIDLNNFEEFLNYLSDVDAMEANAYFEIVSERLGVIEKFQDDVSKNVKERVLQEYIFDHLWLLDPAWERATEYKNLEERIQAVIDKAVSRENQANQDKTIRMDIRYRRVAGRHVIVELKRPSRSLSKTDIESQVRGYLLAVENEINKTDEGRNPIEAVCIVGELPIHWKNPEIRRQDEESLKPLHIRVITYDELIDNAYSAYSKFARAIEPVNELRRLIENIKSYKNQANQLND